MWSVLARVDPGLVTIVRRADETGRRRAVLAACRLAVTRTGVTDDAVAAALHLDTERATAEALYEVHHALLDPGALRGALTSAVGGRRLLRRRR